MNRSSDQIILIKFNLGALHFNDCTFQNRQKAIFEWFSMMKKTIERSTHIILNGIRTLLSPGISIVLSYLIIHYFSKEFWGEIVSYLLYYYIATLISNWGQKDFLLRSFSARPDKILLNWQRFFTSRLPVLFIVIIPTWIIYGWTNGTYLSLWIIATYGSQAIVPIMLFKREYIWVIFTEILSFCVLISLLFRDQNSLQIAHFLVIYAIYLFLRTFVYIFRYRSFFKLKAFSFDPKLLWIAAPFLLLGAAGFLQSKIDLYALKFFASEAVLGEYQIISGFYIFSQSIATILLLPYLKNIYRMQSNSIHKLKRLLYLGGFLLNLFVNCMIVLMLSFYFEITLSPLQLICGFIIGYPAYMYALHIYFLFKTNQERIVLKLSIFGFLINLLVSIVLLSLGQGVTGVLIANASGQIFAFLVYTQYKIDDQLLETFE